MMGKRRKACLVEEEPRGIGGDEEVVCLDGSHDNVGDVAVQLPPQGRPAAVVEDEEKGCW